MASETAKESHGSAHRRPIVRAFELLGQRWTLRILWELRDERLTFRALRARCGEVSPTVLNRRLKELRANAILDHDEAGYGLTECGQELGRHLLALNDWARRWAEQLGTDREA
ncbi:helix-turn-helix transcriptional regulator [Ectothiorhodospiraceae bacterium WFHF3C12]|nr:helix-turn-helix transcriptional regulator [Ectothiorhodospiraceae bacterium WFHF3C12]